MIGRKEYLVKKTPEGTIVKGRYVEGVPEEIPMMFSIQPATPKELREILAGGERDTQLYKGYIVEADGEINQVSKRLKTPADEVFYDGSWWTVVSANKYPSGMSHTRFFMMRVF